MVGEMHNKEYACLCSMGASASNMCSQLKRTTFMKILNR